MPFMRKVDLVSKPSIETPCVDCGADIIAFADDKEPRCDTCREHHLGICPLSCPILDCKEKKRRERLVKIRNLPSQSAIDLLECIFRRLWPEGKAPYDWNEDVANEIADEFDSAIES
jgi:hypothetical protein